MRLFTYFLAALLFATAGAGARADDSAALLAKHRAFVGWQFNPNAPARFETTDTVTEDKNGKALRSTHEHRVGMIFRDDTTDAQAGTTASNGFTGNIFWRSDDNGFTVPVIGDRAKLRNGRWNAVHDRASNAK